MLKELKVSNLNAYASYYPQSFKLLPQSLKKMTWIEPTSIRNDRFSKFLEILPPHLDELHVGGVHLQRRHNVDPNCQLVKQLKVCELGPNMVFKSQ
jgi:hypothetical protein